MPALYTLGAIAAWIAFASVVACVIGLCFVSVGKRADDLSDKLANGDWPHVPAMLRAACKGGGAARGKQPAGSASDNDIARHIGTGL